jgi:hypothetical protein
MIAEIVDPTGMASTRLAEAVGYPGSSVAFAQLLSGMERDGLITREVRGKRTYRIALSAPVPIRPDAMRTGSDAAAAVTAVNAAAVNAAVTAAAVTGVSKAPDMVPVAFPAAIDYDELARRVLIQLVHRLSELNPAELATLEQLLSPAAAPAEAEAAPEQAQVS